MINFPTPTELKELQEFHEPFSVTIYAPPIDANGATDPNRIEVKNLLGDAEMALLSAGVDPRDVEKTLKPARLLLEGHEFWRIHHESLVLFMHPKLFRYYHIPDHTAPYLLTIETSFNLEPLLEVMKNNQQYYILALGHKNVQLYEGDHYGIKPIKLKHFPADMKETLGIDEYPESQESHSVAPASIGKGSEAYHEQYNVSQTDKAMLLEFFHRIDHYLHDFLFSHQKPLIIAGVNYLLPIYRKVNTYPGLVSQSITGNQDDPDLQSLKEKAWSLVGGREP